MRQIGNKIIQLDVVDSTNNFTANLLKSAELVHGTVILADEQTAGRGQRGANWQSEGGSNLIFTVFVEYDNLTVERQDAINHWITLSLIQLLAEKKVNAKIKWPNDIYVNNKKIAGILIENQLSNNKVNSSIIGVGMNVNQTNFEGLNATSLKLLTNEFTSVKEIAFLLIEKLNELSYYFDNESFTDFKLLFHENMWKLNEKVDFWWKEKLCSGIVIGTNDQGLLQIQMENAIETFDLKEISFFIQS